MLRRARKEERAAQTQLFKGRLFKPSLSAADPGCAAASQTVWARIYAWLCAALRLLFPRAIWQREAQSRT